MRRQSPSDNQRGEFATTVIDVTDTGIDGLVLVLGTGASILGRVVAEPGAGVQSPVGMRVSAAPSADHYGAPWSSIAATVTPEWSFEMKGLAGWYRFGAGSDRPPFVKVARITVEGVETAIDTAVELTTGSHEVVVFVTPREAPPAVVPKNLPAATLIERFRLEEMSWRQFEIAEAIVARHDSSVLSSLADWLAHEDRHIRANVAYIFGKLGDPRGLQVLADILTDRSDRPARQGIPTASGDGRYHVARQIVADRYYAVHVLGELGDPQAIPTLVGLLNDTQVNYKVPWALGEIGDKRAIGPLLNVLDDDNPSMRVHAIYALETLDAKEAVPRLTALLQDHRKSNFGAGVTVAQAAAGALAKLR